MHEQLYPALYAPKEGYVFVVTYGRSGSTLTQRLLNSIPGYCIRGENGNLLYHITRAIDVTQSWENYTWRRDDRDKPYSEQRMFLRDIIGSSKDPWYGSENVSPSSFSKSLANAFVDKALNIPPSTRVAGFKEIRWHEDKKFFSKFLNICSDTFPNVRFVFQTRDSNAVSKSSWWKDRNPDDVREMVSAANRMFTEYASQNSERCFTVEYERFREGPNYVQELFDFLEEPMDESKVSEILNQKLMHV